jgi:HK97 family phage portal protein
MNVSETTALGVDAVYGCVRIIADATSRAEWGEWRGTERLPDSRIVRRPMATMTRREWTWQVAATLALYNRVFIQEVGGLDSDGIARSLRPLCPGRVTALRDNILVDGQIVDPSTIRVWRRAVWPSVTNDVMSVLALARGTFAAAMAADAYRQDFWEQGGAPVIALTTDQELTDPQADSIADRWVAKRTTSPGRPAVLSKGAKAQALGADLGTDGANASGDKLRSSVARFFGVPAYLINAPTEAGPLTYSTTESFSLDLVKYTLTAFTDTIGDGMSEVLPGDLNQGRRVRLGLAEFTRAEQESRFRAWSLALDAPGHPGWMTVAEIRAAEGLPPDIALPSSGETAPALEAITR